MTNVLTRKLERYVPLCHADRRLLDEVVRPADTVAHHVDLVREGDPTGRVLLVLGGLAYRYKLLASGRRQIMAYLVPGDVCDLGAPMLRAMDHSVSTMCRCTVVDIDAERMATLAASPGIAQALRWATLVEQGTFCEWLLNIGQRPATERVAHLLCEVYARMAAVGLARDGICSLPLVQADIADSTGLSVVHVNRCLQALRLAGHLDLRRGILSFGDFVGTARFCGFRPGYLHIENPAPIPEEAIDVAFNPRRRGPFASLSA